MVIPEDKRMGLAASAEQLVLPFSDLISPSSRRPAIARTARQSRKRPSSIEPHILASLRDASRVLFLDVETTGLSRYYDELTLVGWLSDGVYRVHVTPAALTRIDALEKMIAVLAPRSLSSEQFQQLKSQLDSDPKIFIVNGLN
jgi:uncharacterized protein YprB with RNaseH-like and TPR domain